MAAEAVADEQDTGASSRAKRQSRPRNDEAADVGDGVADAEVQRPRRAHAKRSYAETTEKLYLGPNGGRLPRNPKRKPKLKRSGGTGSSPTKPKRSRASGSRDQRSGGTTNPLLRASQGAEDWGWKGLVAGELCPLYYGCPPRGSYFCCERHRSLWRDGKLQLGVMPDELKVSAPDPAWVDTAAAADKADGPTAARPAGSRRAMASWVRGEEEEEGEGEDDDEGEEGEEESGEEGEGEAGMDEGEEAEEEESGEESGEEGEEGDEEDGSEGESEEEGAEEGGARSEDALSDEDEEMGGGDDDEGEEGEGSDMDAVEVEVEVEEDVEAAEEMEMDEDAPESHAAEQAEAPSAQGASEEAPVDTDGAPVAMADLPHALEPARTHSPAAAEGVAVKPEPADDMRSDGASAASADSTARGSGEVEVEIGEGSRTGDCFLSKHNCSS